MSRLRIGLDCDGVLYNFDQYVRDQIANRLGVHIHEADVTHWHAIGDFGEEVEACFQEVMAEETCWYAGNAYAGAAELAQRLAEVSDIYILTHIRREFLPVRRRWLELNGFPFKDVIDIKEKWQVVQRLALDAMIDDRFENCDEVAKRCLTPAFLVERPWNEGRRLHELVTRGPLELAVERIERVASRVGREEIAA